MIQNIKKSHLKAFSPTWLSRARASLRRTFLCQPRIWLPVVSSMSFAQLSCTSIRRLFESATIMYPNPKLSWQMTLPLCFPFTAIQTTTSSFLNFLNIVFLPVILISFEHFCYALRLLGVERGHELVRKVAVQEASCFRQPLLVCRCDCILYHCVGCYLFTNSAIDGILWPSR